MDVVYLYMYAYVYVYVCMCMCVSMRGRATTHCADVCTWYAGMITTQSSFFSCRTLTHTTHTYIQKKRKRVLHENTLDQRERIHTPESLSPCSKRHVCIYIPFRYGHVPSMDWIKGSPQATCTHVSCVHARYGHHVATQSWIKRSFNDTRTSNIYSRVHVKIVSYYSKYNGVVSFKTKNIDVYIDRCIWYTYG